MAKVREGLKDYSQSKRSIRKSVVQLECERKLAYVPNTLRRSTLSLSFPVMEVGMWGFFEGGHSLPTSRNHRKFTLPIPKFGFQHRESLHGFILNALYSTSNSRGLNYSPLEINIVNQDIKSVVRFRWCVR